jgi:hypothetical protein
VVITAFLSRWMVVTQAGFSLLFEPRVALADLVTLSIARASDRRPWDLSVLLSRIRNRPARFRFHNLGLLLILSTTLFQFTSTTVYSCQIVQLMPPKANHNPHLYVTVSIPLIPGLTAETSRIGNGIEIIGKRDLQHTQQSLGT